MIARFRPIFRLLFVLALLALGACEATKRGNPEFGSPVRPRDEPLNTLVASVGDKGLIEYRVPREQLAQAFTRQFGDGTSITKTMVRKVQGTPKGPATYYLVGLGLYNGMFRGMALPLLLSGKTELYLSTTSARYIITGVGCRFCFFDFEKNNEIVGTTCEENTGGSRCDLRVEKENAFFPRR